MWVPTMMFWVSIASILLYYQYLYLPVKAPKIFTRRFNESMVKTDIGMVSCILLWPIVAAGLTLVAIIKAMVVLTLRLLMRKTMNV